MKSKTSASLLLFLTFLLGGITGVVSYSIYKNHVAAASAPVSATHTPRDIVSDLAQGLQLTPEQKDQLIPIINQSRERYMSLSRQFRPQYEAIRNETRQQIRQILREDQKARFEQRLKELDSHRPGKPSK